MVNLTIVKQKWHATWILLIILMLFAGERRKSNENDGLTLYLFYSKTPGANLAFKDYC